MTVLLVSESVHEGRELYLDGFGELTVASAPPKLLGLKMRG